MNHSENIVSIHPYFRIRPGQAESVKAMLPAFIQKTANEGKNLHYGFTLNGDELFCREAYQGAEGLLAHLENVGAELKHLLTLVDVIRIEVHGSASELDKLREPLAHLNPAWFTWLGGVHR